jgi:hypothetical protein
MEVNDFADGRPREDSPHRSNSLANRSEQEALELDLNVQQFYPPSVASSVVGSNKFSRWWKSHVSMGVPHVKCRDHLGKA